MPPSEGMDGAQQFGASLAELAHDGTLALDTRSEGWVLRPTASGGFPIEITHASDRVRVQLGGWAHEEAIEAAVWEEMLDLVYAAACGRIELVEHRIGARIWKGEVRIRLGEVSRTIGAWGGRLWAWRPGGDRVVRRNAATSPVPLGEGGMSPRRPWVGLRGEDPAGEAAKRLPLDGELDLHPFSPKEVRPLVLEYIAACRDAGIHELRIVHGKGIGNLRRTVHALLDRHEHVASYRLGGHGAGSWGATLVTLRRVEDDGDRSR